MKKRATVAFIFSRFRLELKKKQFLMITEITFVLVSDGKADSVIQYHKLFDGKLCFCNHEMTMCDNLLEVKQYSTYISWFWTVGIDK